MRPARFHSVSPWRMRMSRVSSTARPQPALAQPLPARRFGEHAGIGIRALELRLEAHQLVAAEGVYPDALSRAALCQGRVQSRLSGPQALQRDQQVAGSDSRLLRRAAFEHVSDGGVIALRSRANAEHREPRSVFRGGRLAALVLSRLRRTQFHFHPLRREQRLQRQFARRAQPVVETAFQLETGGLACEAFNAVLLDADSGHPVAPSQRAHDVIEGFPPPGLVADEQVKAQRDEASLAVVADDRIRRVFILAIVFDPCVETRLGEALPRTARGAQMRRDRAAEQLEIVLFSDQPAADKSKIVVVGRNALERPEERGVILAIEIVRDERGGLDALHVPGVKILVADETEESAVPLAHFDLALARQILARAQQRRGRAMFESPVAFADRRHEKYVTLHRRRLAEEAYVVPAQSLEVALQPAGVGRVAAGDHDVMGHAAGAEARERELA